MSDIYHRIAPRKQRPCKREKCKKPFWPKTPLHRYCVQECCDLAKEEREKKSEQEETVAK